MTFDMRDHFRSLLSYDRKTGVLTWRVTVNSRALRGSRAGTVRADGRRQVRVGGVIYLEHRLIWLIETGSWPDPEVDHRNRQHDDNRWNNLREATRLQNAANNGGKKVKLSGLPVGVYRHRDRFRACIHKSGKQIFVGSFDTVPEAVEARRKAGISLHGDFCLESHI